MARRRTEKKAVVKISRDAPTIDYKDLELLNKCVVVGALAP